MFKWTEKSFTLPEFLPGAFYACDNQQNSLTIVNRTNWLWNSGCFFVVAFCSLSVFFFRWPWPCAKYKRNSNAYEQLTSQSIWANTLDKTVSAGSQLIQPKTKQLCTLLLKFDELQNQLILSTMVKQKGSVVSSLHGRHFWSSTCISFIDCCWAKRYSNT